MSGGYQITLDDFAALLAPRTEYYAFSKKVPPGYSLPRAEETLWCHENCRGKFAVSKSSNGPTVYYFFLNVYDAIHFRLRFELEMHPRK